MTQYLVWGFLDIPLQLNLTKLYVLGKIMKVFNLKEINNDTPISDIIITRELFTKAMLEFISEINSNKKYCEILREINIYLRTLN